jgi:flagellar basal-body rod protein FlgG
MPGGIYVALSGLRHHAEQLDQIASDIANTSTSGYKSERSTSVASERPSFSSALQAAVDVTPGEKQIDFRPGSINGTGRDLDFALDGRGFFVVETPEGLQYTRNGHFQVMNDGTLATVDGLAVQGELGTDEYGPLVLPGGPVDVEADGTIVVGGVPSGKFRIADFATYDALARQENGRFSAPPNVTPDIGTAVELRGGALEQSNVTMAEQLVQVSEVSRTFEALQRGLSVLMNDVDGRAITELGRR